MRGFAVKLAASTAVLVGSLACTAGAATLYAPDYGKDRVSGLTMSPDGSLSSLPGSPFTVVPQPPAVGGMLELAFTPDGNRAATSFLFEGGALGLSLSGDGSVSTAGGAIETESATGVAVTPDGRFAYTPTRDFGGSAEGIRGYSIGADGSLTPMAAPFGADQSYEIAITPDGRFLYQTVPGQIKRFAIAEDGSLTEVGATAQPAGPMAVSPDGRFLFAGVAGESSQGVASFSIGDDGSLTQNGAPAFTGNTGLGYFAVAPDGRHLYMPDVNVDGIVTVAIAADGTLSVVDTMAVEDPETVVVSPDNRFLYYGESGGVGLIGMASIAADGIPTLQPFTIVWDSGEPAPLVFRPESAPRFSAKAAEPGSASQFDARASSGAVRFDWDFGDGSTLVDGGPTPSHSYAKAGVYKVTLTVADANGCTGQQLYTGQSTVCPGGATTTLDTPPGIRRLAVTNKAFAVRPAGRKQRSAARVSRKKVKRGTAFVYGLTERATVRFTIERKRPGRRVGGKCRPKTKRNRTRKKCVLFKPLGTLKVPGRQGRNRTRFSGRLRGRKLAPGRYRATAVATDQAGGRSSPRRVSLRIVSNRRPR